MARSAKLSWALLALLGAGAVAVAMRQRPAADDAPPPAPMPVSAPVAESTPEPAADAPPAPVPRSAPTPATARAEAAALEQLLAAEKGTEREYARFLGAELRPGQTFTEYVAGLDAGIARGDAASMLAMANVLGQCWQSHSQAEEITLHPVSPDHADYDLNILYTQSARLCNGTLTIVDKEQVTNRVAELIVDAAQRGNREAILSQLSHRPYWALTNRESEATKRWLDEAAARLEPLASAGNSTATLRLAELFDQQRNVPKAAAYYRKVIDNAPVRVEEAQARMAIPGPDQMRYFEIYTEVSFAELGLDAACEKMRSAGVSDEACR